MIKRFAIILMCSLLLSGAVVETAQAAHGIPLVNYCPGELKDICEPNISSWSYNNYHEHDGVTVRCWVYGYVYPKSRYCSTCGKKEFLGNYLVERHENCYGLFPVGPTKVG